MAWHDVASQELTDGVHGVRLPDGRRLALVRRADRWWALRDSCPHQGARLSAGVVAERVQVCRPGQDIRLCEDDPVLVCPWHGWGYRVESGHSQHSEDVRVRTYPVRVDAGRVWVDA